MHLVRKELCEYGLFIDDFALPCTMVLEEPDCLLDFRQGNFDNTKFNLKAILSMPGESMNCPGQGIRSNTNRLAPMSKEQNLMVNMPTKVEKIVSKPAQSNSKF